MSEDGSCNCDEVIPFIGLKNKGNTCYLNSILQVLYHCPSFDKHLAKVATFLTNFGDIFEGSNKSIITDQENKQSLLLIKELQGLFLHLSKNQQLLIEEGANFSEEEIKNLSAVCPQDFIGCLRNLYPIFEPYTQQDAQECFHCILNICSSILSLLNENFQKCNVPQFLGCEAKVIGGRRTQSGVLTSNQNKENNSRGVLPLSSSSNTNKLLHSNTKPLKTLTLTQRPENALAIQISDDENDISKKSPAVGCLKSLKRKRLKFTDNGPTSYEKLPKDAPSTSNEKENCHISKLSINSDASEPAPKKRRLGPQHPTASFSQPKAKHSFFTKAFMKLKTDGLFGKHSKAQTKTALPSSQPASFDACVVPTKQEAETKIKTEVQLVQPSSSDLKSIVASNFITDMFHGELVTTIKCMECESKVDRYESFQDVSLPVKNIQLISDSDTSGRLNSGCISPCNGFLVSGKIVSQGSELGFRCRAVKDMDTCSLSWALDRFTSSESLCGDNKYFCEVCMRLSEGERSMRFNKLPPIVSLHLKRFSTNSLDSANFSTSVSKITSALEIPGTAKFTKWCSPTCAERNAEYELFGIVIHSGMSITGGHYLSYVKYNHSQTQENESLMSYDGRWLEMDDERARLLSFEEMEKALSHGDFDVPFKSAYMLFYHRKDLVF